MINIFIFLRIQDLKSGHHVTRVKIGDLYLMMGRELETVESAPAGSVVGIGGLEEHILKSGTLSSTLTCPAFTELSQMVVPIVRVAVEPARPSEMPELIKGLKLLNQADPCVQVTSFISNNINRVVCLTSLNKRWYCKKVENTY
jgi:ribosome assembly protein 1